jgi:hypothetical protein
MALAILLPALAATIAPLSTVDLAYQVRAGELMLAAGAVLREDPFTFTAFGEPWLNQQWGAGVLFALVHGLAGWGGLVVLRAILVAVAVGLVAAGARRWLPGRPAALLALAGFVVALPSLGLRAQLVGIVLFAAVLAILAWRDRRPWLAWVIPVLVLAWANLHGSFFLGPAAVGVALLDDLVGRREGARRLAAVLVASLAATVVTPFGPAGWGYALGIATNPEITRLITEWQRTSPLTVTGAVFYVSVAGAGALLWVARRRDALPSWPTLAWLAALALLGIYAERGVAWWAVAAPVSLAPVIARTLSGAGLAAGLQDRASAAARGPDGSSAGDPGVTRSEAAGLRRLNAILVLGLAVLVVALQPLWRGGDPLTGPPGLLRDAPGGLAHAVVEMTGPEDRVVAPQPWGSWFEWAAPGVPVMVDSRVEVVPASAWDDYLDIVAGGPGALATLDRIAATAVIVDPSTQAALEVTLRTAGSGWRLAYGDDDGYVFSRAP